MWWAPSIVNRLLTSFPEQLVRSATHQSVTIASNCHACSKLSAACIGTGQVQAIACVLLHQVRCHGRGSFPDRNTTVDEHTTTSIERRGEDLKQLASFCAQPWLNFYVRHTVACSVCLTHTFTHFLHSRMKRRNHAKICRHCSAEQLHWEKFHASGN